MESFSAEQLNYFKFSAIVLDVFPVILRQVFVSMWNRLVACTPGFQNWDDSTTVRNMFLAKKGGKIDYVPTDKSYLEWDCTALFQATLFSQTFALPVGYGKRRTLYELYVKTPPTGAFHDCVLSPTGSTAETWALALDQLRLLRDTLCHELSCMQKIDKTTFDHYLMLARDAFTALEQNSIGIDNIEELTEDSFPNAKIQQLKHGLEKENSIVTEFRQVNNYLNPIKSQDGNQVDKWQCSNLTFYLKCIINGIPSMKKDEQSDRRKKDLKLLLGCLREELKMDVLENLNAERQSMAFIICKEQIFSRAVYFILTDKGINSDCVDAASASVNSRDPDVFLFSPASDPKKKSPFVVLWKTTSVLEMKELSHMSSVLHESFHMLFLHSQFQKNCVVGQDFYMEVTLPTYATLSLCAQIDYLPLLVELELSESDKDGSNIDSIVNLPSVHVSYFSYNFSNRRHAEFVFDNLICSLGKLLTLTEVQHVVVSPYSLYNAAIFFFLEAKFSNSSLSVVAENNSVIVKCRSSICEFDSTCNCLLVRDTLESKMECLSHDFRISLKSFNLQLHCEEADVSHSCKYVNRETLLSETGNGCACACRSGPEYVLEGEQNKDETNIEHADLGDAALDRPLWWIVGYGDLHAVVSDEVPLSDSAHCDESKQLDTSLCSNSSLNSCPITPCDPVQEAPDFHERFSDNPSMASVDCSESNLAFGEDSSQLSFGVNNLQDCSVMRSSYEEGLSLKSEKDLSDTKTRKVDLLEDTVEETREEHKCGLQDFHSSFNTESGAMPCTAPQGMSEPSLPGDEDRTAVAMLISQLQSDVAFYQHQCDEERQRSSALEKKLKQIEEEKQQLEVEVGRHQFLECKGKRSEKILHSCATLVSEQSCTVSGGSPAFTGAAEKLLGGAGPLQDPRSQLPTGQTTSDRTTESSIIPPRENSLDLLPENPSQHSSGGNLLQLQSSYEEGLATTESDPVTKLRETDAQYMPQLCHPTDGELRDGVDSLYQNNIRKSDSERKRRFLSAKSNDDVVRLITTAAERDSQEQMEWLQRELQECGAEKQILQAELKRTSLRYVEKDLPSWACSLPGTSTGSHPATGQKMLDRTTESTVTPLKDRNQDLLSGRQQFGCDETLDGMHIQDNEEVSGINEADPASPNMSCNNSLNSGSDMVVLPMNSDSEDSSVHPHFPDSSIGASFSNESSSATVSSSELSSGAESIKVESTSSSCMAHSVCDSSPRVTYQSSAVKNRERFSDTSSYNPTSSEEEILEITVSTECESRDVDRREDYAAKNEEIGQVSESSGYVSDGPGKPPHLKMKGAASGAKDVVDCGPLPSPDRAQVRARSQHVPGLMQDVLPDGDISVVQNLPGAFSGTGKDTTVERLVSDVSTQSKQWEHLGARPRDRPPVKMSPPPEPSLIDLVPQEVTVASGLANAFLARHSQDQSLHESLCQGSAVKLLSEETSSQGAFYMDDTKHTGEPHKAKPYLGDCQVVPRPDVDSRWMLPPPVPGGDYDSYNAVGGYAYNTRLNAQLSGHVGPLSSYWTSGASHFPSSSAFNSSNYNAFKNDLALGAREPYLPLYGQVDSGLNTSVPGDQRLHSGMTGSQLANGSLMGATGPQLTPPVHGLQRYSGPSDNASRMASEREKTNLAWKANSRQTSVGHTAQADVGSSGLPAPSKVTRSNGADNRHVSEAESRRTRHYEQGTGRSNVLNTCGDRIVSGANRDGDNTHTEAVLLSAGSRGTRLVASGNEHSNLEPRGAEASLIPNTGGSMLNRDFGTDSVESTDNSLLALEQRVEEACALVERVLREREEREQFGKEIERKEREIRERRARMKREREAREQEEASRWPQQQEPITGRSQWLCEHYQRHCRVRFPCCSYFYPCHRCHNNSKACKNEEAKACHATHLKCSFCQREQEIGEDSGKCRSCGAEMSAYFCSICKHFTSVDKNPYHCKKCGICRIHKDKSFHCEVCNVCLDKRLEGKHKCRPDSGHDECCICLEDAFSGCQILPCSHKVHRECAIAMIQNNIRTCPVCRHPLYSQTSE